MKRGHPGYGVLPDDFDGFMENLRIVLVQRDRVPCPCCGAHRFRDALRIYCSVCGVWWWRGPHKHVRENDG